MRTHPQPADSRRPATPAPSLGGGAPDSPATGLTPNGRFANNDRGSPGNPFARQVAALRRALLNRVTAVDIEEVLAALLIKSKTGDLAAIKLLLAYTIGRPGPAVDPDTLEQQEWQLHQQAAVPPAAMEDVLTTLPAATANRMVQVAWPCAAQQHLEPLIQGLQAADAADAAAAPPAPRPPSAPPSPSFDPSVPGWSRPPSANGDQNAPPPPPPANPRRVPSLPPMPSPDDPDYDAALNRRLKAMFLGDQGDPPDTKPG